MVKKDKDSVTKSGGKAKKKKWFKGKVQDKLKNLVLFDKASYDKFCKEVPNHKLITPAVISEIEDPRFLGHCSPSEAS